MSPDLLEGGTARLPSTQPTVVQRTIEGIVLPPAVLWTGAWLLLVATLFATRPVMPVDETRYVAVAWEMWIQGDFLVPHLNGALYSHKPPLLFWCIQLGWFLFGVNEWWPRLVPPLFGLGNLVLVGALARRLWRDRPQIASTVPLILLGCLVWTFFTTTLTFDMMVVFFTLLTLLGWLMAEQGDGLRGWALAALGIGLGVLAKGPVILVFVLPPALAAPWWSRGWRRRPDPTGWLGWYGGVLAAFLAGAVLALAWAIPAAASGGPAYRDAIFFHQTADRLVRATAHPEPWWWYLPVLPAGLFPFTFWPPFWKRVRQLRLDETALRFLLAWAAPAFVILSLVSAKQPHYILPLFPACGLLIARVASPLFDREAMGRLKLPLLALAALGGLLLAIPLIDHVWRLPSWLLASGPGPGLILLGTAALGLFLRRRPVPMVPALAGLSLGVCIVLHLGVVTAAAPGFDVAPIARQLAFLESEGVEIAHAGPYHGQFHFAGRLTKPLLVIPTPEAASWLAAHPQGCLVGYYDLSPAPELGEPMLAQPFRNRMVGLWRRSAPAPAGS